MKIAIFGDIHANLEGLQTVLGDAYDNDCASFCCIGDIVGYNANPSECIDLVCRLDCPVVMGNHDEEASANTSLESLNPVAKSSMEWTRLVLEDDEKDYLRNLKMRRQVRNFTIVHASLDSPESWTYVNNRFDASTSLSYQTSQVCFCGHTHVPCAFIKLASGEVVRSDDNILSVIPNNKYLVNCGSAGQPRDGDWRVSYCIYDTEKEKIFFRRLEYDLRLTQKKIRDVNLPNMLAERLAIGR